MPYNEELHRLRDRHFMEACRKVIATSREPLTAREIAERAAAMPAPAFYISYSHALRRIRDYIAHDGGNFPTAGAMAVYAELHRRMLRKMRSLHLNDAQALNLVLAEGHAPHFYLQPRAAEYLYYALRSSVRRFRRNRRPTSTQTVTK